jgi:hypothetical protein
VACRERLEANASVTAGDDDVLAAEVDAPEDVIGGGCWAEAAANRMLLVRHAALLPPVATDRLEEPDISCLATWGPVERPVRLVSEGQGRM